MDSRILAHIGPLRAAFITVAAHVAMATATASPLAAQVFREAGVQGDSISDAADPALAPARSRTSDGELLRSPSTLRPLISDARNDERRGEREVSDAKSDHERAKGEIRILDRDRDALKARMDLAKDEGREADRARFERERDELEFDKKVLERMRDIHDARRKLAEAERDAARARILALEAEQQLYERAMRLREAGRDPMIDPDYLKAERQMLERQRDGARSSAQVADREDSLVGKRLNLVKLKEESARS